MSTVEEIQAAIAGLLEPERLRLYNRIHSQKVEILGNDPKTLREAEAGARHLDAGQGIALEVVRTLY